MLLRRVKNTKYEIYTNHKKRKESFVPNNESS